MLTEGGFFNVSTVPSQAEPDRSFPSVSSPNPEEKGALDLAISLAKERHAELVLANDPDVDRLAVAVRDAEGSFVQLTGNQVGALLGHYVLTEGPAVEGRRVVISSVVSSPALGVIARALGVDYEQTLTGFKWIANRAIELERQGATFVYGYEEALGYTVGTLVRDKDGISSALLVAELAAILRAEGRTLLDDLESLARTYGLFVSRQRSVTLPGVDGAARIANAMQRLRASPPGGLANWMCWAWPTTPSASIGHARGHPDRWHFPQPTCSSSSLRAAAASSPARAGPSPESRSTSTSGRPWLPVRLCTSPSAAASGTSSTSADAFMALAALA